MEIYPNLIGKNKVEQETFLDIQLKFYCKKHFYYK